MAWLVVLAVLSLPVVEIALFIKSSQWIGILPTIALAIIAGMAGLALVRAQGFATLFKARQMLDRGQTPVAEAFDGICLGIAGFLLVLPGFLSDVVALLLLVPPVRALLRRWLLGRNPPPPSGGAQVIDGEYRVVENGPDARLP